MFFNSFSYKKKSVYVYRLYKQQNLLKNYQFPFQNDLEL